LLAQANARARIVSAAAAFPERADTALRRVSAAAVSLGCAAVDAMLGGGLCAGELTEVFGASASGKTQMCHQLAAVAAARAGGGRVVYIDTTASFSAGRLAEIAAARGMSVEHVLSRVEHVLAFDAQAVLVELRWLRESAAANPITVVIVDSVAAAFASVLARGRAKGHAMLSDAGTLLRSIAAVSGCVAVTTNFAYDGSYADGGGVKPALGAAWASSPHCRILLSRVGGGGGVSSSTAGGGGRVRRTATLAKSARAPTGVSAQFCLDERGVNDYDDAAA